MKWLKLIFAKNSAIIFKTNNELSETLAIMVASFSSRGPNNNRKLEFDIISGTSMSCLNAYGATTYINNFIPLGPLLLSVQL
ncbi:hypothetical protein MTR_5g012440 [Medicago truncatula]|uniref:Uncharacterized protein n=1 Tax=Medicago truncatula TaxID=3880 RepID=G7JW21_MEDTR|nr:hypothetical protein MTR_5g012440 [Medicago truncatula]